jgi:hypothetical protein
MPSATFAASQIRNAWATSATIRNASVANIAQIDQVICATIFASYVPRNQNVGYALALKQTWFQTKRNVQLHWTPQLRRVHGISTPRHMRRLLPATLRLVSVNGIRDLQFVRTTHKLLDTWRGVAIPSRIKRIGWNMRSVIIIVKITTTKARCARSWASTSAVFARVAPKM